MTPAEEVTNAASSTTATNEGRRTYTLSGLDDTETYRLELRAGASAFFGRGWDRPVATPGKKHWWRSQPELSSEAVSRGGRMPSWRSGCHSIPASLLVTGSEHRPPTSGVAVRDLDFGPVLVGYLASIWDERDFAMVTVDEVAGTLCWPDGIDFDPDVLHGDAPPASGESPTVLAERHRHGAG